MRFHIGICIDFLQGRSVNSNLRIHHLVKRRKNCAAAVPPIPRKGNEIVVVVFSLPTSNPIIEHSFSTNQIQNRKFSPLSLLTIAPQPPFFWPPPQKKERKSGVNFMTVLFLCHYRCLRFERGPDDRTASGEVPVCTRGILPDPLPQPANQIRKVTPQTAIAEDSIVDGDWAAFLCSTGGKDPRGDPDKRHALIRIQRNDRLSLFNNYFYAGNSLVASTD